MGRPVDSNVVSIHKEIVTKNTVAISEASKRMVEDAMSILRLSGMKKAVLLGINEQTGDSECEIVITFIPPKKKPE